MKNIIAFGVITIFVFSTAVFGQQYPMLEDVRAVSVTIDHAGADPNNPHINWPKLQLNIAKKISAAGIEIEPVKGVRLPGIPDLNVTVMMVAIPETEQFVFHVQTSLYRLVNIPENSKVMISSPVWAELATMQSVAAEDTEAALTKAAMKQVEKFIGAWQSVQPKSAATAETQNLASLQKAQPPVAPAGNSTQDANTPKYLASKNGKVFHLPQCRTAKGFSGDSMITFASREEALDSGRRPCKRCNP
jgi:hypothetical protein